MTTLTDTRPMASITLAALGPDPRIGLERAAALGVRGVQLSAGQSGTQPQDLGASGRRDVLGAAHRLELVISGVDAWIRAEDFVDSERMDRSLHLALEAIELASDLGRLPLSLTLPDAPGAEEIISTLVHRASLVGVELADHARPVDEGRAGTGWGIDLPAWVASGDDILTAMTSTSRPLTSLRLADLDEHASRTAIGGAYSRLDVEAILLAARAGGYNGLWVIDARQWRDVEGGVARTLELVGSR